MNNDSAAEIGRVIRERRTLKAFAAEPLPVHAADPEGVRAEWESLLAGAAWAPFHRAAHECHRGALASIVPWRFHALDAAACRTLCEAAIERWGVERGGNIPRMLGAAEVLVQATWLPNPPARPLAEGQLFEPTVENMEHVAAAGAAVQNLLLLATARGIPSYWSSGGVLREARAFEVMGIPAREVLLGSIFLFPRDAERRTDLETKPGAHRDKRGELRAWMRWVDPAAA